MTGYLSNMDAHTVRCIYQTTSDGRYCIGWCAGKTPDGWNEYDFSFSLCKVSIEIGNFLKKQEFDEELFGRVHRKGFVMMPIHEKTKTECNGIKRPFFGIVEFRPYTCVYNRHRK